MTQLKKDALQVKWILTQKSRTTEVVEETLRLIDILLQMSKGGDFMSDSIKQVGFIRGLLLAIVPLDSMIHYNLHDIFCALQNQTEDPQKYIDSLSKNNSKLSRLLKQGHS